MATTVSQPMRTWRCPFCGRFNVRRPSEAPRCETRGCPEGRD